MRLFGSVPSRIKQLDDFLSAGKPRRMLLIRTVHCESDKEETPVPTDPQELLKLPRKPRYMDDDAALAAIKAGNYEVLTYQIVYRARGEDRGDANAPPPPGPAQDAPCRVDPNADTPQDEPDLGQNSVQATPAGQTATPEGDSLDRMGEAELRRECHRLRAELVSLMLDERTGGDGQAN